MWRPATLTTCCTPARGGRAPGPTGAVGADRLLGGRGLCRGRDGGARRGLCLPCCGAPVIFKPGQVSHPPFRPPAGRRLRVRSPDVTGSPDRSRSDRPGAARARPDVELEAPISGVGGDRRIDVLTWPADRPEARVAIEVQASDIGAETIAARTTSYQQMGVAPLWLRLLDFASFPRYPDPAAARRGVDRALQGPVVGALGPRPPWRTPVVHGLRNGTGLARPVRSGASSPANAGCYAMTPAKPPAGPPTGPRRGSGSTWSSTGRSPSRA